MCGGVGDDVVGRDGRNELASLCGLGVSPEYRRLSDGLQVCTP